MTKFLVDRTENILNGDFRNVIIAGKEIFLAKFEGVYYAIGNVCKKSNIDGLHKHFLKDDKLVCSYHNVCWNIINGNFESSQNFSDQQKYDVVIEQGNIYIHI